MNWEKCNSCRHRRICVLRLYKALDETLAVFNFEGEPVIALRKIGVIKMNECPHYETSVMEGFAGELKAMSQKQKKRVKGL